MAPFTAIEIFDIWYMFLKILVVGSIPEFWTKILHGVSDKDFKWGVCGK